MQTANQFSLKGRSNSYSEDDLSSLQARMVMCGWHLLKYCGPEDQQEHAASRQHYLGLALKFEFPRKKIAKGTLA